MKPKTMLILFPAAWRKEYGAEMLRLLDERPLTSADQWDLLKQAVQVRLRPYPRTLLLWVGFAAVWFFNLKAVEVQWAAGMLLLFAALTTWIYPKKWLQSVLILFLAVPMSTMVIYQNPSAAPYHAPRLYETLLALLPALFGSAVGAAIKLVGDGPPPQEAR